MEKKQDENKLAERLQQLLKWKGVTQYKLAKDLEISRSHLNMVLKSSKNEKGTLKGLSDEKVKLIANYFRVDYNYLKSGVLDPQISGGSIILNTFDAFQLEGLMDNKDVWDFEQRQDEFNSSKKTFLKELIYNLNDFHLECMYNFLDSILSIEYTHYVFLHFLNQLNNVGIEKLSNLMNSMTTTHKDSIVALPQAINFYKSEKLFDECTKEGSSREFKLNHIENRVFNMNDEKICFLFDHFDHLLALSRINFQMLKRFSLLENSKMKFSDLGYNISSNHELILDYLEALLLNKKFTKQTHEDK